MHENFDSERPLVYVVGNVEIWVFPETNHWVFENAEGVDRHG